MGIEIERKFLVDHEKWRRLTKPAGTHYRQGYLLNTDNRTIRVRVAGDQGFITLKGATNGISRSEYEYNIPVTEALEILDGFATSGVEKTRYVIVVGGKLWEVDEFLGDNIGLIVAEIELEDAAETFEKPGWVTNEVSHDARYYNSNLSTNPYKNWHR